MRLRPSAQLAVLALSLLAARLEAQLYPMPGSTSEAPVICTGCPGNNAGGAPNNGLPTYPYAPPLTFVGRYVDSQNTANFQHIGFRTARARFIRAYPTANGQAPPRIFIQIGNAAGVYSLGNFFSQKLPAGPVSVGGVQTGSKVGGFGRSPLEKITMWESFFYPEALAAQWYAPLFDQQDPMAHGNPFDVDDRGYIYGSWPTFGWGIVRDDGRSTGAHFRKVVQMVWSTAGIDQTKYPNTRTDPSGVSPYSILSLRDGANYYAVIAGSSNSRAVFDVTTPATPIHLHNDSGADKAMLRYDRSDAVGRVAYLDAAHKLQVYAYSDLITSGAPVLTATSTESGGFKAVTFDEAGNVWVIGKTILTKFTVVGSSYVPTDYTPFANLTSMTALSVRSGRVAVIGTETSTVTFDVRVARIDAGGPVEIDLNGFFKKYYHGGAPGYAQPGQYTYPANVELVQWNGKTYLLYSAEGLGDVYELQNSDVPACDPPTSAVVSISGSSSTCISGTGGTASVTASGGGAVTYQWGWRPTGGGTIQQIDGATSTSYQLAGAALGPVGDKELVVTVTSACGAPLVSNAVPITVTAPPQIALTASSEVFESSTGNSAAVSGAGVGETFFWQIFNGTIESGQGTAAIHYSAGASGEVQLTATATTNVCPPTGTVVVPIVPRPSGATMLYLIAPCRVLDTRDSGSPVASGATLLVPVVGTCGVPSGTTAVSAIVTVVGPSSSGWLSLYPADVAWPGTSTVNYRTAKTRANNGIVAVSANGEVNVLNGGPAVHVLIDITAYFK